MKKFILIGPLLIILLAAAGLGWYWWQTKYEVKEFTSAHVSFNYRKDYTEQPKAAPLKDTEAILKLAVQAPLTTLELNREVRAKRAANITKQPLLDLLEQNADKTLTSSYPHYSKLGSQRIQISGHDSTLLRFTYIGQDNATVLYAALFMMPLNDDVYFLTMQSVDKKRWEADTKTLQASIELK